MSILVAPLGASIRFKATTMRRIVARSRAGMPIRGNQPQRVGSANFQARAMTLSTATSKTAVAMGLTPRQLKYPRQHKGRSRPVGP